MSLYFRLCLIFVSILYRRIFLVVNKKEIHKSEDNMRYFTKERNASNDNRTSV